VGPLPRGLGRPLEEGLRVEAECFNRSIFEPETVEGLRRFNERDYPDLARAK
jgi:enoyl-CoA hydratase